MFKNSHGNFQSHRFITSENIAKSFRGATFLTHTVDEPSCSETFRRYGSTCVNLVEDYKKATSIHFLLANVNSCSCSLYVVVRPSVCRLSSVVCNVRAPYSGDWNFRQCFYAIWYLGHLWPFDKNFTEIVTGEPLRRGVKPKRGSKI